VLTQDVINALNATATLMAADEKRTTDAYGAPVGIPVSMAAHLIKKACASGKNPSAEWIRLAHEQSIEKADAQAQQQRDLEHQVFDLLFPDGARSNAATADDVRALAAKLAEAKP
jgi:hypothetical protein